VHPPIYRGALGGRHIGAYTHTSRRDALVVDPPRRRDALRRYTRTCQTDAAINGTDAPAVNVRPPRAPPRGSPWLCPQCPRPRDPF